jgi:hypothetical protein
MLHVDWPLVSAMNKHHKSHEARVFNQILIRSFIDGKEENQLDAKITVY